MKDLLKLYFQIIMFISKVLPKKATFAKYFEKKGKLV